LVAAFGIFALVSGWSAVALAEDAGQGDADSGAAHIDRVRKHMAWARYWLGEYHRCLRKQEEAKRKSEQTGAPSDETDARTWGLFVASAREYADEADRKAREAAEQGGPVAEAMYWHMRASNYRFKASQREQLTREWLGACWLAGESDERARGKLREARNLARTNPQIRAQLSQYCAYVAADYREQERALRQQAVLWAALRCLDAAAGWEAEADAARRSAEAAEAESKKYGTPPATEQPNQPKQPGQNDRRVGSARKALRPGNRAFARPNLRPRDCARRPR
jgi:hypothetical protein